MQVKTFRTGVFNSNSYALINDDGEAVLIDAGSSYNYYTQKQRELGFTIKAVLLTHGHFDHTTAGASFKQGGVPIYISEDDSDMLSSKQNLAVYAGFPSGFFTADEFFYDGQILRLCGFEIKVISTPGHTAGSACFLVGDKLFSGDTLFLENIGRTDFPTGSHRDLINSVKNKLFTLDGNVTVYPGHDEPTTIAHERANNPFVKFDAFD